MRQTNRLTNKPTARQTDRDRETKVDRESDMQTEAYYTKQSMVVGF